MALDLVRSVILIAATIRLYMGSALMLTCMSGMLSDAAVDDDGRWSKRWWWTW